MHQQNQGTVSGNPIPRRRGAPVAALALGCVLSTSAVVAQEGAIEEIIVTATKRGDTALMETPISINVVTGEDLKFRQIRNLEDLRSSVSGVYIDEGSSIPKISIRGIGLDNFNVQAENGITTYVDGVIIQRANAALGGFLDLAQVEVLKGPQGSAFGRNATGGSINLITAKPQEGFSGELSGGFGSFSGKSFGGVLNNGGETFGIRVAASYETDDGYMTNLVTGNDELGAKDQTLARLSLSWNPSDSVSVDYSLSYFDYEFTGPGQTYTSAGAAAGAAGLGTLLGLTPLSTPLTNVLNDDYTIVNRHDPITDRESTLHALTVEFDLGGVTLKSITGYMDFESLWRSDVAFPSAFAEGLISVTRSDTESEQFSQEFLLSGSSDKFNWVTGVYYLDEEARDEGEFNLSISPALPPGTVFRNPGNGQNLESFAVFADGQLSLTDRTRLNAGVRWTDDEKEGFGRRRDIMFGGVVLAPGTSLAGASVSDSTVTWQVGLEYDVSDDIFTYIRIAEGYKAGGINNSSANNNPNFIYQPEELLAYEVGIKGNLTDNLILSASAFYNDYENIQLFVNPPSNPGTPEILNAAAATIAGIELDGTWNATEALSFDAKVTWLSKAEYDDFAAFDGISGGDVDHSGEALNRSPDFTGVFGVNWFSSLSDRVDFTARAEVYTMSEVAFSFLHHVRPPGALEQDGYELVNLYLTATIDDQWDVRAYAKNITDEFYVASAAEGAPGFQYGSSGRPDEYGLEVRFRF